MMSNPLSNSHFNRGVHYALSRDDAKRLFAARTPEALTAFLDELSTHRRAGKLSPERVCVSGEMWRTLHRALTDGSLDPQAGEYPLNQCFLGGRPIGDDEQRMVRLVRPDAANHVADALSEFEQSAIHERYMALSHDVLSHAPNEQEFQQIWSVLEQIYAFFQKAAEKKDAVLFVAENVEE